MLKDQYMQIWNLEHTSPLRFLLSENIWLTVPVVVLMKGFSKSGTLVTPGHCKLGSIDSLTSFNWDNYLVSVLRPDVLSDFITASWWWAPALRRLQQAVAGTRGSGSGLLWGSLPSQWSQSGQSSPLLDQTTLTSSSSADVNWPLVTTRPLVSEEEAADSSVILWLRRLSCDILHRAIASSSLSRVYPVASFHSSYRYHTERAVRARTKNLSRAGSGRAKN